ncbi:MAG: hypothetical protein OEX02_04665 [Cyclobacteriaceae bacterium]|nr:hypothetical protein [Cyclobacteriaceae bacterium]
MTEVEQKEDLLREIINIGIGRAASVLNEMIASVIELDVPEIKLLNLKEIWDHLEYKSREEVCTVSLEFKGSLSGSAKLVLRAREASSIVSMLTGENDASPDDIDVMKSATLTEVGNILLNSVLGNFSNILDLEITYDIPLFEQDELVKAFSSDAERLSIVVLMCKTKFFIQEVGFSGLIMVLFNKSSFHKLDNFLQDKL